MSESRNEKFEAQFAAESLEAGIELSLGMVRSARDLDGDYSQYPYMQSRWNQFNATNPNQALAGEAQ